MPCHTLTRLVWIVLPILFTSPALATAVFAVGTGPGCGYPTIQAAVDAAQAYPGDEDYIHISRSLRYTAQAITIGNQTVHLVGGLDDCNDNEPSGKTTISGAGGATEPVFRINGPTGSLVTLRNLDISFGDEDSGGYGGGIYYRGNGVLQIDESNVSNNIAGYGGGIYAEGTGYQAELIIGSNVTIANNTARGSGGGIYVDSLEMTMIAPGSILAINTAQGSISGGFGGGLLINSIDYPAYGYLGSSGQGALGLVYGNVAQRGGGVAVVASNEYNYESELHLFGTDSAQAVLVRANFASVSGGGLYVRSTGVFFTANAYAYVRLWNAAIDENEAPDGAAVHLDFDDEEGGVLMFSEVQPDGAAPCPVFRACGRIAGNRAVDINGEPTSGSVIHSGSRSLLWLNKVAIENNQGGRLIHASHMVNSQYSLSIKNAMISGNQATLELIRVDSGDANTLLSNSTIAGNAIGASNVILSAGDIDIERSIVWQPGKTSLQQTGGTLGVEYVIASETASLGSGAETLAADPRFIDPARGDHHLRAASPAVDFAPAIAGYDDYDVEGLTRDLDLPIKQNRFGEADIGAHERQNLPPLVLNPDFDADLNLWPSVTPSSASWDASQNIGGSAGSGSVHVLLNDAPQARVVALSQCIHLPGPSLYRLNGWGRSIGAAGIRDSILLHWEYRADGGEACNAGPPTLQADHPLTTSTAWSQPAAPAWIDVPAVEFTGNSSITVQLVVIDNAVSNDFDVDGWFDGITLEPDLDLIFADGFDS